MGVCADNVAPRGGGMGLGMGYGSGRGGRGRRNRFWATGLTGVQRAQANAPISQEQERELLEAQAAQCEQALADIRGRLEQLDNDPQS
jgi:hypothetical protein